MSERDYRLPFGGSEGALAWGTRAARASGRPRSAFMEMSSIETALLIVLSLAAFGIVLSGLGRRRNLAGYEAIRGDVRLIANALRAEVRREGGDLVIVGEYRSAATQVRFSNAEHTPGLTVRMQAPATFAMSVVPAAVTGIAGTVLPTSDVWFDRRFTARSWAPVQARMVVQGGMEWLRKLMCSSGTYLAVERGVIELHEMAVPAPFTASHLLAHLEAMAALRARLQAMPGADAVKYPAEVRERQVAGRVAIAAGLVVAVISVVVANRPQDVLAQPVIPRVAGVLPADAITIPNLESWRLSSVHDFSQQGVNWQRRNGYEPQARIEADFAGRGLAGDVAYVLVREDGTRRVVMLVEHQNRFDSEFGDVAIAARLPNGLVRAVKWQGGEVPAGVKGDGLLLVRDRNDTKSAVVLFVTEKRIVSAAPADWTAVPLY